MKIILNDDCIGVSGGSTASRGPYESLANPNNNTCYYYDEEGTGWVLYSEEYEIHEEKFDKKYTDKNFITIPINKASFKLEYES